MKTKTLQTLPPDPKSMEQAILRIHHQLYYWLGFDTKGIAVINAEKFGWAVERKVRAVTPPWFKRYLLLVSYYFFY